MGTYWRTEPAMDSNPAGRLRLGSLHRPQVYVKVEFGVSWSQRQAPNNHGITYRSRNLRERLPNFPRQVPAPTTNYLAGLPPPTHGSSSLHPEETQPRQPHHFLQDIDEGEERRSSRDSRSSHERGRSAPPPINNSPWDITQLDASGMPSSSRAVAPAPMPDDVLWKELPEVPTRFRLGEDGMPWSAWSWPMDYDPDSTSRGPSPGQGSGQHHQRFGAAADRGVTAARSPQEAARDAARNRELEALSAAMVTVDNGFENQWWNQGSRETVTMSANMAASPPPPAYEPGHVQSTSVPSLGWAIASERPSDRTSYAAAVGAASYMVSPMTAAADFRSPPPLYQSALTRSLSTRSDEMFLDGGRWA